MKRIIDKFTELFVFWVLLVAGLGIWRPALFGWVLPNIKWMLGLIMFGMGMTLTAADFKRVCERPRDIFAGACAQYMIMPLLAYAIARVLRLPDALAVGMILLGCCPGGTASNVIAYLARGDVALSVSMTTVSTMLAPLLTPALTFLLAGHWMRIDTSALLISILQIVLVPVLLGTLINNFWGARISRLQAFMPSLSVIVILLIVGAVVGKEAARIGSAPLIFAAVILHNSGGLCLGWWLAAPFRMTPRQQRTLAIEVGMQNSGLAAALAVAHLSPAAALPAAIFSVWHNISGPLLAALWSRSGKI